jgi:hypothetical protein
MSILTKILGHEKRILCLTNTFDKVTFLTKCQYEDLVKMDKCLLKWPWFNQIDHIEWVGFSQINYLDLTFSQMGHTHLLT